MKPLRSTATLFAICWSLGCEADPRPCNPYVQQNEAFDVTVVGPFNGDPVPSFIQGVPSCGLDDVRVGDQFDVELEEHHPYGNSCYQFRCPRDFPTPAQSTAESTGTPGLNYVCIGDNAKVRLGETCELGRFVALHSPRGNQELYEEPSDRLNQFTLLRVLTTTGGGNTECSDLAERYPATQSGYVCADQWQVRLTERKPSAAK